MKRIWRRLGSEAPPVAVLLALTLIFFWKIAFTNRILAGLDVFAYFYPYRDCVSEAARAGQLPLWNPYLFMGAPLLANSQAAVLYPLHWPLIWLSSPKQVAWSIVLHVALAGAGTYLLCRQALHLSRRAAWTSAVVFALGGFLGAQVEHVNQLNATAWLPWLLLCLEHSTVTGRRRALSILCGGLVVALSLLAGHTQASYIVLAAGLVYATLLGLRSFRRQPRARARALARGLAALVVMCLVGIGLAAAQLAPTLELSRLSVRSGGLPYNEAASFSLSPGLIFKALLPPFLWAPPFSEYVAYVGVIGLGLAGVGIRVAVRRSPTASKATASSCSDRETRDSDHAARIMLVLAALGLFLAFGAYNPVYYLLYKIVPGLGSFRAPARWLLLYSFGMAVLSGIGLESLRIIRPRTQHLVGCLLAMELFVAGRQLAYNKPTAPAALDSMRTAPAHLLAEADTTPFRFLSMSDIQFDPGDLEDLEAIYSPALPSESVYDLIVATKMKEVLAYNLPMVYRLHSVDGYDGGLLPTRTYVTLERLFLPEDQIWPDGRLRQQLGEMPPNQLLSLLNVRYIITDKLRDVWIDGVFYDLQHTVSLGDVTLDSLPGFETTDLGVVSFLRGASLVEQGTPVAEITIRTKEANELRTVLRAGIDTAEGTCEANASAHHKASIGHQRAASPGSPGGNDYVTVFELGGVWHPEQIVIRSLLPEGSGQSVELRALSLIDRRSGTGRNLDVNPSYRLVHSGDVKVYENLSVLPRAFVAYDVRTAASDEDVLAQMLSPDFNPARTVILAPDGKRMSGQRSANVQFLRYEADQVELRVTTDSPGQLVLSDAHYPGWRVEVDGQPASIQRADLYFRSIALDEGTHHVWFYYRPLSVRLGLGLSLGSVLGWIAAFAITVRRIGRRVPSRV